MISAPSHVKWPKNLPPLTDEQIKISDDFMKYWHEVLPKKYGIINSFNHGYPMQEAPKDFLRTLEIGSGDGEHLVYEKLTPEQEKNYFCLDIRENMVEALKKRFPNVEAHVGDCQERIKFDDNYFDPIIAIHILEHLPNLPSAVREIHRLCDKENGLLSIVIPCEGSLLYTIARKISAERIFKKRYGQDYSWFIDREHINNPEEIFQELLRYFTLVSSRFFPFPIKLAFCNLCIGATFRPRIN
jgi:ubiquinone/menaquinone biosynthesis C-methylase UbiE